MGILVESREVGAVGFDVYGFYIRKAGIFNAIVVLFAQLCFAGCSVAVTW
jgi:hypothetical protein